MYDYMYMINSFLTSYAISLKVCTDVFRHIENVHVCFFFFFFFFFFFCFLLLFLKGYCTVFQRALKSLEITGIILSLRMSKTARKNSKGLKSYKEFKF